MFEDLKKSFNEDGFVVVRDLFDSSEIKFYREVIKEAIQKIIEGTITKYIYDPSVAELVEIKDNN